MICTEVNHNRQKNQAPFWSSIPKKNLTEDSGLSEYDATWLSVPDVSIECIILNVKRWGIQIKYYFSRKPRYLKT
jgi:hypothetical protein